jgi:hypothetical protein
MTDQTEQRIPVVGPGGKRGTLPAALLTPEAQKLGYRAETPEETATRTEVNADPLSALKVGTEHTLSKATFGATDLLVDASRSPADRKLAAERDRQHPNWATGGDILGTAANIAATMGTGIPEDIALGATKYAVEAGMSAGAARFAGHIAANAAYAAPSAAVELAKGKDPASVGEAFLLATGVGAALGHGADSLRLPMLSEGLVAKVNKQVADKLGEVTSAEGMNVLPHVMSTVGGAVAGPPGAFLGRMAGKAISKVRPDALRLSLDGDAVQHILSEAQKHVNTGIEGVNYGVSRVALYTQSAVTSYKDLQSITDTLEAYKANPTALPSGKDMPPEVHAAATEAYMKQAQYLLNAVPRDPDADHPLNDGTWRPSRTQLREFNTKLSVARDPYSVVYALGNGTLDENHVEALDATYPALASTIRQRLLDATSDPAIKHALRRHRKQFDMLARSAPVALPGTQVASGVPTGVVYPGADTVSPAASGSALPRKISVRQKSMSQPTSIERVTMGG